MAPQVSAQIEDWLSQRGRPLVAAPLPPAALRGMVDYFARGQPDCARAIVDT